MELPRHIGPARSYAKGWCGTLQLLRHVGGSALPRALPWGLIAAGYTAALHSTVSCNVWPTFCANGHPEYGRSEREFLLVHTYAYHAVLLASGFGLVFRLNQSLMRYWEARSAAQSMAAKWCDGLLMALSFDEDPAAEGGAADTGAAFARSLIHLGSLLHAVAMHTLRGDKTLDSLRKRTREEATTSRHSLSAWLGDGSVSAARAPIEVLGGVSPAERAALLGSAERVHIVLGWLTRLLVRRRNRGGLTQAEAPIVSRVYQVLSDGTLWYHAALKVVDTPFPFAYAQLNAATCFVNLAIFPVIVADKVASLPLGACISFCCVFFLFALNEVARELEDPFTTELGVYLGANRLHVPRMQAHFDERCLAVGGGYVGGSDASAVGSLLDGPLLVDDDDRYGPFLADLVAPLHRDARRDGGGQEGGKRVLAAQQVEVVLSAPPEPQGVGSE